MFWKRKIKETDEERQNKTFDSANIELYLLRIELNRVSNLPERKILVGEADKRLSEILSADIALGQRFELLCRIRRDYQTRNAFGIGSASEAIKILRDEFSKSTEPPRSKEAGFEILNYVGRYASERDLGFFLNLCLAYASQRYFGDAFRCLFASESLLPRKEEGKKPLEKRLRDVYGIVTRLTIEDIFTNPSSRRDYDSYEPFNPILYPSVILKGIEEITQDLIHKSNNSPRDSFFCVEDLNYLTYQQFEAIKSESRTRCAIVPGVVAYVRRNGFMWGSTLTILTNRLDLNEFKDPDMASAIVCLLDSHYCSVGAMYDRSFGCMFSREMDDGERDKYIEESTRQEVQEVVRYFGERNEDFRQNLLKKFEDYRTRMRN